MSTGLDAGKLTRRITFQTNTPTANSMGEFVDTWTDYVSVWTHIEPLRGNRYFLAKQSQSEVSGEIIIRYRTDILASMRIKHKSSIYKILSIFVPDMAQVETHIFYKEIIP